MTDFATIIKFFKTMGSEGLAKFDYKLNIEVKLLKHSSIIFGCPA
jgi:hypothetical protein